MTHDSYGYGCGYGGLQTGDGHGGDCDGAGCALCGFYSSGDGYGYCEGEGYGVGDGDKPPEVRL
jgi:hypothetical protein